MNHFQRLKTGLHFKLSSVLYVLEITKGENTLCVVTEVPITDCSHSSAGLFMFDQMIFLNQGIVHPLYFGLVQLDRSTVKNWEQQTAGKDVKFLFNSSLSDSQLQKSEPGGKVLSFIKQHEGDKSKGEGADPK